MYAWLSRDHRTLRVGVRALRSLARLWGSLFSMSILSRRTRKLIIKSSCAFSLFDVCLFALRSHRYCLLDRERRAMLQIVAWPPPTPKNALPRPRNLSAQKLRILQASKSNEGKGLRWEWRA